MREPPERRCLGNEPLMLSTHPADHSQAKKFCADCPAATWCRRETDEALAHPSYGLGVEGTWAGVLYRDGRVVTRMEARGHRAVGM
jgi:hypothetical protein